MRAANQLLEAADLVGPLGGEYGRSGSFEVFAGGVICCGVDLHRRDLCAGYCLAVWMVVARGAIASSAALSANDPGCLCDLGNLCFVREPEAAGTPEPDLVHDMVERGSCGDHGGAGVSKLRSEGSSLGRCASAVDCGGHTRGADTSKCAGRAWVVFRELVESRSTA